MTAPPASKTLVSTHVPVAIISVDLTARRAEGLTQNRDKLRIDFSMPVGGVYVIPAVGDQWYIDRIDAALWKLSIRIPFNDNNTLIAPVEGQQVIGGTGPVELNAPQVNMHGDADITGLLGVGGTQIKTDDDGTLVQSSDGGDTWVPVGTGTGVAPNAPIEPGTGTKITYDAKGLVTSSSSAAVADITGLTEALAGITSSGVGLLTAKGDLLTRDESSLTRKPVGADGKWLKADPTSTDGLSWASIDQSDVTGLSTLTNGLAPDRSILDQFIGTIPGAEIGLTGLTGLTSIFGDLVGVLGSPLGLGSGSPTLPIIGNIPILGGLLSGGTSILSSLIPGLDASKIVSGLFPLGQIANLTTMFGGFGTATSILDQLIGTVPGLTTGLTGLVGLASIFGDLTGLLGGPTALGSGSPVLPVIGSIPILGGLLTGGTSILSSLIPGLDASKIISGVLSGSLIPSLAASVITSGTFVTSLIPGLDVSKIVSGVFGTGFIPNLPASIITSGIFGAGQIPGFDASKIISGVLSGGIIPQLPIAQITTLPGYLSTLFGPFNPPQLIGTGQVSTVAQNLLLNPIFDDASSMLGELMWVWDAVTHSATGGSAKVNAAINTSAKSLLSNPIQIAANDTINASAWTQWNSLVYSGTPISLMLNLYDANNSLITAVTLATATMTGATSSWAQLSGSHVIAETGAVWARLRFNVDTVATAGSVWFSDASLTKPNPISQAAVSGLPSLVTLAQATIDQAVQALFGTNLTDYLPADLKNALSQIPPFNVGGLLGQPTVADTIQHFVDTGVQGIVDDAGTLVNQSLSAWNTQMSSMARFLGFVTSGAAPPNSVAQIASNVDSIVKDRAVQKPPYANIDPTVDATFELRDIWQSDPLPIVDLIEGATVMGDITVRDGGNKLAVTWYGYPEGGSFSTISDFRINVYTIDNATNIRTRVHGSADYVASVGTGIGPVFNSYNLPSAIVNRSGDKLTAELEIIGAGTYHVVGQTLSSQILAHPTYGLHGASRTGLLRYYSIDPPVSAPTTKNPTVGVGPLLTDNCVMAAVSVRSTVSAVTAVDATYGGVPMTLLALSPNVRTTGFGYLALFGYIDPTVGSGGPKDVAVTTTGGGVDGTECAAQIVVSTYPNVVSFGTAQTHAVATGANLSHAVTGALDNLIFQAFLGLGGTFTAYNEESLASPAATALSDYLLVGDAVGSAATETITVHQPSARWTSIAVPITVSQLPGTMTNPGSVDSPAAFSNNVPWIGLSGIASPTQYSPVLIPYYSDDFFDPTLYGWANFFDRIVCGAGGGGSGGNIGPTGGGIGAHGNWAVDTLTKAEAGTSLWAIYIPGPSAGGPAYSNAGGNGGNAIIDTAGVGSITGPGGAGAPFGSGSPSGFGVSPGQSAGDLSYTDANGQEVYLSGGLGGAVSGASGTQPGGSGAGGNSSFVGGAYTTGGGGGAGIGFIRVYQ